MFFCFSFIGNLFHKTLHSSSSSSSIVSANFPKFFCWMVLYSSAHFCIIKPPAIRHEYFLKSWSLSQKSSFCDCRVEGYFGFDCPSSVSISFFSIKGGSLTTSKQRFKKSLARSSKGKRLLNLPAHAFCGEITKNVRFWFANLFFFMGQYLTPMRMM